MIHNFMILGCYFPQHSYNLIIMPYTIEQKIGNHTYLYEVESYWDPEKKQPRQRRKYLGKKDPEGGQLVRPRTRVVPRLCKDYGHVYLLQTTAERVGLTAILKRIFPKDYQTLLALAFFEISEAAPLYLFASWREFTDLKETPVLRSKELTAFTQRLGCMEQERLAFASAWIQQCGEVEAIIFDITSLSCYAEFIDYVEWGYNRDEESLPQINFGVIYAEHVQLPLYYQLYPGSIPDVTTLKNIVNYLELFQLKERLFILDRGFYSASNLSTMHQVQIKFIIPMSSAVKVFSALLSQNRRKLSDLNTSFVFGDEVLFHVQDTVEINQIILQAHLYFNDRRRSEEVSSFLRKILELETAVQEQPFSNKEEAVEYLASHFKGATRFFHVKNNNGKLEIRRNTRALSQRLATMGTTLMLTNHADLDRAKILELYRRKDYLEKTFDVLKNEFDGRRLRGHSKDVINGRLFIKFISLILYSAIANKMREKDLFKHYSMREIMYELKKLRIIEMHNGISYLTEISKRQREIFSKLEVETPIIRA
jgi:transposase